jgi:WD40 repeat protein
MRDAKGWKGDFRCKGASYSKKNHLYELVVQTHLGMYCLFKMCILSVVIFHLAACTAPLPTERPTSVKTTGDISSVALSPDGNHLAVLTDQGVHLYQEDTFQEVWFAPYQGDAIDVVFSPDGTLIAAKFVTGIAKNTVVLWNVENGQLWRTWEGESLMSEGTGIAFSPDGTTLASGSVTFNVVDLWDVHTGSLLRRIGYFDDEMGPLFGSGGRVWWRVAWSSDGNRLAFGSFDGRLVVWDLEKDEPLHLLKGHQSWVWDLAFSPDGTKLVSCAGSPGQMILWDMATAEQLFILSDQVGQCRGDFAWSPDGTTLASSIEYGTVTLWDVRAGEQLCALTGHTNRVLSRVAFNPDGTTLVSASPNEIIEWNVKTCEKRRIVKISPAASE